MTGKQNGKPNSKSKYRTNRSSVELPQKEDGMSKVADLSLLRKPIQTSVTGFVQARDVFDTGTEEIKQLLSTECDVIYECRVCRNLFRSLANFISHKRIYCRQKFNTSLHTHFINTKYLKDDMMTILQNEQDYQNFLNNKHYTSDIAQAAKDSIQKPFTKDLTSIIERLTLMQTTDSDSKNHSVLQLQPTSQTNQAVYQNLLDSEQHEDFIKEQLNEIDRIENSQEATLGPDGKIITSDGLPIIHISDDETETSPVKNIVCRICKLKFSTQKTLRFHIKHKHAENRLVYPCPDCEETFANAWGVYRHLFKIHRKSAAYIRKLRESIHNKAFKLQRKRSNDMASNLAEDSELSEQHRLDLENQEWMDNLEGDCEVPRCGGCGRKFERRAALSSHRQTCQLRIAAQNKITTNMQKRQAAKVGGKEQQPQVKSEVEKVEVSPAKISRVETKPIEIQIRRDYHKVHIGSPKRTGTPNVETSNGSISEGSEVNRKGEKGDISIINIHPNIINSKFYNIETGKDYDDANNVVDGKSTFTSHSINTCNNSSSNINTDDEDNDDELNFEDIRRICQATTAPNSSSNREAVDIEDCDTTIYETNNSKQCETSFTCNKCKEELSSLDQLHNHIKNKHEVLVYQCKFCNYKSKLNRDCIDHVKDKHKMLGDDERIGKFVKSLSVPLPDAPNQWSDNEDPPRSQTMEEGDCDSKMALAEFIKVENVRADEAEQCVQIKQEVVSVKEEVLWDSSEDEGDCKKLTKRRRSKKSEDELLEMVTKRKSQKRVPLKGSKVPSKKTSNKKNQPKRVASAPTSCRNSVDARSEDTYTTDSSPEKCKQLMNNLIILNKNIEQSIALSNSDVNISLSDTKQHSASSMSSSVRRPIRNRIKRFNKDFEYDLSNLLKLEAEAYKESHLPTVIHKQPIKRKTLLQNETNPTELFPELGDQVKLEAIERKYAGALQTLSVKAAEKRRAHMKKVPLMIQRELPQFIAQRRSRMTPGNSSKTTSPQKLSKKEVSALPKTKTDKNAAQQQITPSMIYEKLSLDNIGGDGENNSISDINIECDEKFKSQILANMSKILSKGIKKSSKLISVKKEKDLLNPSLSSKSHKAGGKLTCLQDDETSEFVMSDKLTSVNILRRTKSSAMQNKKIITLSDKVYKKKNSSKKNDADNSVDVSEIRKSVGNLVGSTSSIQDMDEISIKLSNKFYKRKSPKKNTVVSPSPITSSQSSDFILDSQESNVSIITTPDVMKTPPTSSLNEDAFTSQFNNDDFATVELVSQESNTDNRNVVDEE